MPRDNPLQGQNATVPTRYVAIRDRVIPPCGVTLFSLIYILTMAQTIARKRLPGTGRPTSPEGWHRDLVALRACRNRLQNFLSTENVRGDVDMSRIVERALERCDKLLDAIAHIESDASS